MKSYYLLRLKLIKLSLQIDLLKRKRKGNLNRHWLMLFLDCFKLLRDKTRLIFFFVQCKEKRDHVWINSLQVYINFLVFFFSLVIQLWMVFFIFFQDNLLRTSYFFITFSQSSHRSSFLKAILVLNSDFRSWLCSSLSFCTHSEKIHNSCLLCSMMTSNKHLRNIINCKICKRSA